MPKFVCTIRRWWIRRWWTDQWIWFMSCHARRGILFNYNAAHVDYDYFNFNNDFVHQMIICDFNMSYCIDSATLYKIYISKCIY